MSLVVLRVAVFSAATFAACFVAFRLGGHSERRTALLVTTCLALTLLGQVVTGRRTEPAIAGDFLFGVGLLLLLCVDNRVWLWVLFALEAVLFFMHAFLYETGAQPSSAYALANDAIVMAGCAVLIGASVRSWKARSADIGETAPSADEGRAQAAD